MILTSGIAKEMLYANTFMMLPFRYLSMSPMTATKEGKSLSLGNIPKL